MNIKLSAFLLHAGLTLKKAHAHCQCQWVVTPRL